MENFAVLLSYAFHTIRRKIYRKIIGGVPKPVEEAIIMTSNPEQKRRRVFVVGVGMTKFVKPGSSSNDYPELVFEAVTKALDDAKLNYNEVEHACVGYVYGDSTCGQRALYEVGMSGIPIYNVNNNCSTGSTALLMAKQLVEGGIVNCALALGFEKMAKGSLTTQFDDRTNPLGKHVQTLAELRGFAPAPVAAQFFGSAGREHMEKYGTKLEHFAKIAEKNHRHSAKNPNSQFQDIYTLDEILASPMIYEPLTKLQCCPTSDGSAAAIVVSEDFVHAHGLENQAVEILGMEMSTDIPSTFEDKSCIKMVGFDMTRKAAETLYRKTNLNPKDVDVVELHDCFSTNELITYEALGLCDIGKGGELVDSGNNTYGGKYVVNPSGGLISKGHPLGATGIAQCVELSWQLRNEAGERQVPGAKLALQHNIGLGGAVVVSLYKLGFAQPDVHVMDGKSSKPLSPPKEVFKLKSSSFIAILEPLLEMVENILDKKIAGAIRMNVRDDNSDYEATGILNFKKGKVDLSFDPTLKADCTVFLHDSTLYDILTRKITPERAFFSGKVKIRGNVGMLTKLLTLKNALLSKL